MKALGRTPRNLLLGSHILFAAAWMGGVATLLLLSIVNRRPVSGEALSAIRTSLRWVDWVIIIPSCLGSLGTGFLFSLLTNWGFFRHTWVLIKWGLTVAMILFGIFFLGPWVDGSAQIAAERGIQALSDGTYDALQARIAYFSALQIALLVFMLFLSTLKPFGKRGAERVSPS